MGKILELTGKLVKLLAIAIGGLFTVYFFNLDQKIMGWAYIQVNEIFNRKKVDIKF